MHRCLLLACLAISVAIAPCMARKNAQPRPGCVCTAIYDPVCGSDGSDYSSQCQADCAGATVAYSGICRAASNTPVSSSSTDNTAAAGIQLPGGLVLNLPTSGAAGNSPGCICNSISNPVCGEDGQTYSNDCQASCAGVAVAAAGECKAAATVPAAAAAAPKPPLSVTQEDSTAPAAAAPPSTGAGQAGCVCSAVVSPVCGDNGKTYGNMCEADCAGVAVNADGPCQSPVAAAATPSTAAAPVAVTPVAAAAAPAPAPKPEGCVCAALYDPVCGANGKDYPSACDADCAGIAVASKGVCRPSQPAEQPIQATPPTQAAKPATPPPAPTVPAPPTEAPTEAPITPAKPDACVCPMIYAPVCTDKGVTRSNKCVAACRGEKVVGDGSCNKAVTEEKSTTPTTAAAPAVVPAETPAVTKDSTPAAGGKAAAAPAAAAAAGAGSTTTKANNTATTPGKCDKCGESYTPVCGADGVTYSNTCEAECLNGAKVAFAGVCGSRDVNITSASTLQNSAVGLRGTSSSVFGGFAVAAATLLAMVWL